ncbi:MAG: hypothetical protein MZV64_60145 [Ignavibacteriales bacterium]|nr:hypothetical protein [Ignavibacteriales bacterium]
MRSILRAVFRRMSSRTSNWLAIRSRWRSAPFNNRSKSRRNSGGAGACQH